MNVEVVSKHGSSIDTDIYRFWYDDGGILVEYGYSPQERYQRGETIATDGDTVSLDTRSQNV